MKEVYNGAFALIGDDKTDLGETSDHRQLSHKDAEDQHPISSITGLTDKLDAQDSTIAELKGSESEVIRLGKDVDAKIDELVTYKEAAIAGIELAEELALKEIVDTIDDTIESITATAEKIDTGQTPTVSVTTDEHNILFSFGLPQGEDGEAGHTPEKGVDYWTAADKAEIVADVLADAGDAEVTEY